MSLSIEIKIMGKKKPLLSDWSIDPPAQRGDGDPMTLRKLIILIAGQEAKAFQERQKKQRWLQVLTSAEIEKQAKKGKIFSGEKEFEQEVHVESAIGTALQAFEDGLYLVIIDEEEKKSLDELIYLKEDSKITFLRLTMLSGG